MSSKPDSPHLPAVKISGRGVARLKQGHVWVYRSDIFASDGILPGAVVSVIDERGKALGTALYSGASQIAIRMISPGQVSDLETLLRDRIRAAIVYRERVVRDTDAYRLVFSEGDFLPGLIVDRYNDILCLQVLTQAIDSASTRETIISELTECFHPARLPSGLIRGFANWNNFLRDLRG